MSLTKYILPALAVIGSASAACSIQGTTTVQNAGDASAFATCTKFTGNIAVATGTSDPLDFGNLGMLEGDLVANSATSLNTISANSLTEITGNFSLIENTVLANLNFAQLTKCGTINWITLPALQSITANVQQVSNLYIQDTQLGSLDGISLKTADTIWIAQNNFLSNLTMQLTNVTGGIQIQENGGQSPTNVMFPNLKSTYNATFRNCSSVTMPSLEVVNTTLGFFSGGMEMMTFPNLTNTGSLTATDNEQLNNMSFPKLKQITGGLTVGNNPLLKMMDGFASLTTITGALDMNGNFTSVALPAIHDIRGAFNLQSSGDISSNCTKFKGESGSSNVIKGKFTCAGKQSSPGGAGTTPTGTNGAGASPTKSASAAIIVGVQSSMAMGALGVFAAILGIF